MYREPNLKNDRRQRNPHTKQLCVVSLNSKDPMQSSADVSGTTSTGIGERCTSSYVIEPKQSMRPWLADDTLI